MSYSIRGSTIVLTRGDSFYADIGIFKPNGEPYIPLETDHIRFAVKKNIRDESILIFKEIPNDTLKLRLGPEDTKNLDFGEYVYDIQLTKEDGDVDTFITASPFIVAEEVD